MFEDWSNVALAENCAQETRKYLRAADNITTYCYELFKRTFEDKNEEALSLILSIYSKLVLHWIRNHKQAFRLEMPYEYYVADCCSDFVEGVSKHEFSNFPTVSALLKYWQVCANNVVRGVAGRIMPPELVDAGDVFVVHDFAQQVAVEKLWRQIEIVAGSPKLYLLAKLSFEQDQKPKAIVAAFPQHWPDTNSVRVDLQKLKRRLRADSVIRASLFDE